MFWQAIAWIITTVDNSARKIAIMMSRRAATVRLVGTARGGMEVVSNPIWMENIATLDLVMELDCGGGVGNAAGIQWNELQWKSDRIKLWSNKMIYSFSKLLEAACPLIVTIPEIVKQLVNKYHQKNKSLESFEQDPRPN